MIKANTRYERKSRASCNITLIFFCTSIAFFSCPVILFSSSTISTATEQYLIYSGYYDSVTTSDKNTFSLQLHT